MKRKAVSLALAVLLVLSSVSCASETQISEDTSISPSTDTQISEPQTTEINRENATLSLSELDFENTVINFLYVGEAVYAQDVYADESGDIVDDAVFARNRSVEELLNVTLNPIKYSDSTKETADHLATIVLAGEDLYDLASVHQGYSKGYVLDGYFHNFANDEYIDFEKPWWNTDYMEEMIVGDDRIYFLIGDISLMYLKSLACIYYNKQMYEEIYKDPDEPYELVFDGKWTFEKFDELVRSAYSDINGNGEVDDGDRFGAFGSQGKSVEHFFYGAGLRSTTRNKDGIPELTINNEKTIAFTELLYKLYYENDGFILASNNDTFKDELNMFLSNEILFAPTWFRHSDVLRTMETDYGIVCMPKYLDEDEYTTLVHDGTTVFVTPVTSQKTDIVGAVCEAIAFYNYKTVTPAYYEVALKVKYSRDDMTSQMLDLISSSAVTDFGYVYYQQVGGIPSMRSFVQQGAENFTSWYQSRESAALEGLKQLIDTYQGVE